MKHLLPGTPLSFKVERIFKSTKERVQSQSEAVWMPVLLGRLLLGCLRYFSDCEVQASSVGD